MSQFSPFEVEELRKLVAAQTPKLVTPTPEARPAPVRDPELDKKMAAAVDDALAEADTVLANPSRHEHLLEPLTTQLPDAQRTASLPTREGVAVALLEALARRDKAFNADLTRWVEPARLHPRLPFSGLPTVVGNHVRAKTIRAAYAPDATPSA